LKLNFEAKKNKFKHTTSQYTSLKRSRSQYAGRPVGGAGATPYEASAEAAAEARIANAAHGYRRPGTEAVAALPRRTRVSNLAAGVVCAGFVAGTYYWTIHRMKSVDPLAAVEDEAAQVSDAMCECGECCPCYSCFFYACGPSSGASWPLAG
jgi:hypothetical protein